MNLCDKCCWISLELACPHSNGKRVWERVGKVRSPGQLLMDGLGQRATLGGPFYGVRCSLSVWREFPSVPLAGETIKWELLEVSKSRPNSLAGHIKNRLDGLRLCVWFKFDFVPKIIQSPKLNYIAQCCLNSTTIGRRSIIRWNSVVFSNFDPRYKFSTTTNTS